MRTSLHSKKRYKVTCWPGAEYFQLTCADALPIVAEAAARAGRSACLMPLGLKCAAPFSSTVEFRDQELLVQEGQPSQTMYVIVEGECRLLLKPGKQKRKKKGKGAASTDADEVSPKKLKHRALSSVRIAAASRARAMRAVILMWLNITI